MDEVSQAQEQLGRALARAQAGEDRALAGRVRAEGERLVNLLNGVLSMAHLHNLDNRAFDQPLKDLEAILAGLAELLGAVRVLSVEEQIYVNDIRMRLEGSEAAQILGERLRSHQVGGIAFHAPLAADKWRGLTACLAGEPRTGEPHQVREALAEALVAHGVDSVELMGLHRFVVAGESAAPRREARMVAQHAAGLLAEGWENLSARRVPNPLPFRRVVSEILNEPMDQEGFWEDPSGSAPYAAHNIRVCKLALLLGEALGLSEGILQDLGVAAMYHDVGYASRGQGGEGVGFAGHPSASACLILRQRGFHEAKIRRALAALEHHRRHDDEGGRPALFARILAIAEDYDTLTRRTDVAPDEALRRMAGASGAVYDPVLLQLFINALGRYPLGTAVRLSDGRSGIVSSLAGRPERFEQPLVRIELLADGSPPAEKVVIDLQGPGAPTVTATAATLAALGRPGQAPGSGDRAATPIPAAVSPAVAPGREGAATPAAHKPVPSAPSVKPAAPAVPGRPLYQGLFPEILRGIYVGRKTGVLRLWRPGEERSVRFWKGNVVRAESNMAAEHLGEVAVREGLMSAEDLGRINAVTAREGRRVGSVMRELGILNDRQIEDALAVHAREVILQVFPWSDGSYAFEEREADKSWFEELTLKLSTPDLILEAVRHIDDPDVVRFQLGNLDRPLRQGSDPRLRSLGLKLTALDGFVLSRIDGHWTAREVIEMIPQGPDAILGSLFGLICVGLAEFVDKP